MTTMVSVTGKWNTISSCLAKHYNVKTTFHPFLQRSIYGLTNNTTIIGSFTPSFASTNHFANPNTTINNMVSIMQPTSCATTMLNLIDGVNNMFRNAIYGFVNVKNLVVHGYLFATQVDSKSGTGRTKVRKQQRGRMKGISFRGNQISFGTYALQALEPAWITSQQIEAGRKAIVRNAGRGGKIWVRVFPDKPVTARPAETRMGKGKGALECWVAVVKPGRIIYEMSGVTECVARKAILVAASKMPVQTQFLTSGQGYC